MLIKKNTTLRRLRTSRGPEKVHRAVGYKAILEHVPLSRVSDRSVATQPLVSDHRKTEQRRRVDATALGKRTMTETRYPRNPSVPAGPVSSH